MDAQQLILLSTSGDSGNNAGTFSAIDVLLLLFFILWILVAMIATGERLLGPDRNDFFYSRTNYILSLIPIIGVLAILYKLLQKALK